VQGLPVTARISSIRTRTSGGLAPYFYFVFQETVLADAPQTIFCAARLQRSEIGQAQTRLVARFPNVSVIDLTEAAALIGRIMGKLSGIVRFFTAFSVVAGILMVAGAVFATRYARLQESVYFAMLGARRRFVLAVFALENLLLGAVSGVIALAISQLAGAIVCRRVFSLEYRPYLAESLLMLAAALLLVVAVGVGASLSILRQRPAAFLREQADE
jgi:putative ABC transport system permease protein